MGYSPLLKLRVAVVALSKNVPPSIVSGRIEWGSALIQRRLFSATLIKPEKVPDNYGTQLWSMRTHCALRVFICRQDGSKTKWNPSIDTQFVSIVSYFYLTVIFFFILWNELQRCGLMPQHISNKLLFWNRTGCQDGVGEEPFIKLLWSKAYPA